jgi:uncharacterized membrane protein YphA (DoxX/SURF4 family)
MQILVKASRISYGIMIAALAIQQFFYAQFRTVIFPPWPPAGTVLAICTCIVSFALVLAGLAIIFDKRARTVSLILGGVFLLIFCFAQVPYKFMVDFYKNLGSWTSALKELAISGGAFVVAGSFPITRQPDKKSHSLIGLLEKIIPFGSIFFCITITSFGIDHFLYAEGISTLVPNWIPGHMFWTYFAGIALAGSGVTIILRIKLKLSALLLALMIFLWLIVLHIPRAIADPYGLQGNEVSSVFEAFGFSGVAYLIAYGYQTKKIA